MVLTNIISQSKYIFPHIFLPHINLSRRGFNTISLSWSWVWRNKIKNNEIIIERNQHHILNIVQSTLLVYLFEGVPLLLVILLLNTQRFWQIWATLYSVVTWIIQNFQRELKGMAYRKVEPAVPSLAMLACTREQRAIVLPPCFL